MMGDPVVDTGEDRGGAFLPHGQSGGGVAADVGRDPHDNLILVRSACSEIPPVEPKKQLQKYQRRALVTVGEGMVSADLPLNSPPAKTGARGSFNPTPNAGPPDGSVSRFAQADGLETTGTIPRWSPSFLR